MTCELAGFGKINTRIELGPAINRGDMWASARSPLVCDGLRESSRHLQHTAYDEFVVSLCEDGRYPQMFRD